MVAIGLMAAAGSSQAEVSVNLGLVSEYIFRGIPQTDTSASAGLDFEHRGFYVGTWAADVGDGLEVDGYFGYGTEVGDVSLSIGYTGYFYTGDFDDTYQEINLSGGFSFVTLDITLGEYDNFGGEKLDYQFYSLTAEYKGFWGQYGMFDDDFDGDYFQIGYDTSVADFDVGLSLLYSDETLAGTSEEALIFSLGKTFDIN